VVTSEHMHARSHASGTALCGATGKFAWSLDPDAVTCPKCRATLLMLGEPLRPRRDGPLLTPICLPAIEVPGRSPPPWKAAAPIPMTPDPDPAPPTRPAPAGKAAPRPRKRR
jgi:hypothetical protein